MMCAADCKRRERKRSGYATTRCSLFTSFLSMEVARNLGHSYVAPEHLLLAVLSRPGELTKLVEGAGVTFDSFGSAIRELGPSEKGSSMELGMAGWSVHGSPRAMKWLVLLSLFSRIVGWLALVIAVIALILAIRAQP